MQRSEKIRLFLKDIGWKGAEVTPLAGDASFRRYDRVVLNGQKAVLMDAPPEFEDTRPFVAVASYLRDLGLAAPKILARDFEEGFLLLEDLGDNLFKTVLEKDPLQELTLYKKAVDELVLINRFDPPSELPYGEGKYTLPHYDMDLLLNEIFLFSDWYYPALTGKRMPFKKRQEYAELWKNVLAKVSTAKECLVLRDYHAENLLSLENGKIGMLDFQDAVIGHAAYDLVSLLQDARRDVDSDTEEKMVDYMADKLGRDKQIFKEHYAILEKNVNVRAKELSHELNKTKDTLLLKSDKKIDYVYAINSTYHREVDTYVFENSFKVPLNKLSVGKHLFVVGQNHMKIIFVVRIVEELSKIALVTDKKVTTIEN